MNSANEKLGLPRGSMKKVLIAFDVDGTLRDNTTDKVRANEDIRTLIRILSRFKNVTILLWSGSGELYARQIAKECAVDWYIDRYASKLDWKEIQPDIAIDDIQDTAIGKLNLIVREK